MKIFISHAVVDRNLADEFARFLGSGCNLGKDDIFLSSKPGMGIPNGKFFVQDILSHLNDSDLVIALLTPSYFDSEFCIAESGAAQLRAVAQGKAGSFYSFLVPPAVYSDLAGVLFGVQSGRIDAEHHLDSLSERMKELGKKDLNVTLWNSEKKRFLGLAGKEVATRLKQFVEEKVVPIDKIFAPTTAANIHFKTKFRVPFRNDTGRNITVSAVSWKMIPGGVKRHRDPWFTLQRRKGSGWDPTEFETLQVHPGEEFMASVAFEDTVSKEKFNRLAAAGRLGIMQMTVDIEGYRLLFSKRF